MEIYPVGESGGVRVEVRRDDRADEGFTGFGVCLALDQGAAIVRLPGHYGAELATRIRQAEAALSAGVMRARRTYRDEYLDLTVVAGEDGELLLSSTARVPLRLTVRLPQHELLALAGLLEQAHALVETLRRGLGLVPDHLPEDFAAAD